MRTRWRAVLRHGVVWLGHAPALWLFYREPLPRPLRRPNAIAVAATLLAMIVVAAWTRDLVRVGTTWVLAHVAWGSYLSWRLPDPGDRVDSPSG